MTYHLGDDTAVGARRAACPGEVPVTAPSGPDISALFRQHQAGLVRLAVLLVRDRPAAEDVVQDAFAALHARRDRLGPQDDTLAYVRASVVNGCRRVLRRRAVALRAGARDPQASWPGRSAEDEVIWSQERRRVLAALAALPRRRREVLVLRYYLGLSEAEIAAVLKIRPGTVKSTAARGLAALAHVLEEGP